MQNFDIADTLVFESIINILKFDGFSGDAF